MFSAILGVSTVRWWNDMWWSIPFCYGSFFPGSHGFSTPPRCLYARQARPPPPAKLRELMLSMGFSYFLFTRHVKTHDLLVPWLLDVSYDAWVMACQTPTKHPEMANIYLTPISNLFKGSKWKIIYIIVLVLNNHSIIQLVVHSEVPLGKGWLIHWPAKPTPDPT